MILIIDNYDSFTYNLAQYLGELGSNIKVIRNNKITIKEIYKLNPKKIVISPGPCTPLEAGISNSVIKNFYNKLPILGVCLGHQCIAYSFGGLVNRADKIMHGKVSKIYHDNKLIFKNIKNPFLATRYHSLIVRHENFPEELKITCWTEENEIMGISHKVYPLFGVQFHPESILTTEGKKILKNFLEINYE